MFDSGGSSGQLRDELGVLPPGDILRCALALARNEGEARRVLLSRLPTIEHARLGGHTGGNLLLSMMQQYTGDFLAAVGGLRALLGCQGHVWPVSVEQAMLCAEYADGTIHCGEVEVDRGHERGHEVRDLWLEPDAHILPVVRRRHRRLRRGHHRSWQLLHEPDADAAGRRRQGSAGGRVDGPIILVANLLTEGRGMQDVHRGERGRLGGPHDRPARGRRPLQHRSCRATRCWRATSEKRSSRWRLGALPASAPKSSKASSGARTSRATTAGGCRTRCGRCSAGDCL